MGTTTATAVRPAPVSPWLPVSLPEFPSLRDGSEVDEDVGPVLVPVVGVVGAAVDERVTVVFEGPLLTPVLLSVDVGGVEEGDCWLVVGLSDVVVGGVCDVVVVGTLLVVVGGGAAEEEGRSVVDSVVGGGGADGVVTEGTDVLAVEDGCLVSDVGVGVPGVAGPILVVLEDMVKRRSKVSRRRGGLYMVTLAPARDGEVQQNRKASLTFS
jgi:hypothetical protein